MHPRLRPSRLGFGAVPGDQRPLGLLGGHRAPGLWITGGGRQLLDRAAPGVLHADLAACDAYRDAPSAAASVRRPTLLLLGECDVMTPPKAARALAEALPDARTVALPDCGHMMTIEQPDAMLDALRGLLQNDDV